MEKLRFKVKTAAREGAGSIYPFFRFLWERRKNRNRSLENIRFGGMGGIEIIIVFRLIHGRISNKISYRNSNLIQSLSHMV